MQIKCAYLIISALILKIKLKVSEKCYAIKKTNVTPSQIIDPVDKTTIIDKKGKIEKCLIKHFGDIGRDSTHKNEAHTNYVKKFISQAQNEKNSDKKYVFSEYTSRYRSTTSSFIEIWQSGWS